MKRERQMLEKVADNHNWAAKRILASDAEVKRLRAELRWIKLNIPCDDFGFEVRDRIDAALKKPKAKR